MPWYTRLQNIFRSGRISLEIDSELGFHLAERVDHLMAEGMPEGEAWRQARLRLGNYGIQKERTRDMNVINWLEVAWSDFSFGLRQLRLNPGFTVVAVCSLALGIGANTAIFQLIDALRLRGLPVKESSQLVAIDTAPDFYIAGSYSARNQAFTYAQVEALKQNQKAFTDVLAFGTDRFDLSTGGPSRFAEGLYVSANFLRVLGVTPIAGRDFSPEDDQLSCSSPGALLNYAFWQREFGGDLKAIGKTISFNGHRFPVIGITPPSFFGVEPGQRFDVALPLCTDNLFAKDGKGRPYQREAWWLTVIGRLKLGWSIERASTHLRDLSPAIFRNSLPAEYRPEDAKPYLKNRLRVVSASAGVSSLRRQYENPLWILMGITALVLLIACANLANLLLARASAREREIAVRQALGASRSRLLTQLLCESLLLAVIGGVLGACLAQVLSRATVVFLNSPQNQVAVPLSIDWYVFSFVAALAVSTCLLFGLAPAIRASGAVPAAAMRGGRTSTATRERNGLRRALVAGQVALSLVLLVAALLFGRSLQKLFAAETGFNSQNVLAASITSSGPAFANEDRRQQLFRDLQNRFDSLNGVVSAAPVWILPISGFRRNERVHAENDSASKGSKLAWINFVGPRYFSTMQVPILAGRDVTSRDKGNAPLVAVVNQTFAKVFFGGQNPIGRSFRVEQEVGKADLLFQVVGLVADTKYRELREQIQPIAFFSIDQQPQTPYNRTFVIRARGSLDTVARAIQRQVADLNPTLLIEFKVLDVQIRQSVLRERLMANLSGAFGLLAACLSTLGLYGVIAYMVARRRNEIGVRLALGATQGNVFALILKDACIMLAIGLVVGMSASLLLSRYAESLLFGLKGNDPLTLILAAALLVVTAIGATLIPARQAARLEPVAALREE